MLSIKELIFLEIVRGFALFILFILKLSRRRALKRSLLPSPSIKYSMTLESAFLLALDCSSVLRLD